VTTDTDIYRVQDYWARPSETLARQQGDCEDFAILKMAALRSLGFAADDLALVVLRDDKRKVFHAVLSVSVSSNRFILDSLREEVLTDSRMPGYKPLLSIVDGKGYLHGFRVDHREKVATQQSEQVATPTGS
jgi:predicted transglutaminase-like cysteine proteinase